MRFKVLLQIVTLFLLLAVGFLLFCYVEETTVTVKEETIIPKEKSYEWMDLLPEADKMFEKAVIEKPRIIYENYYGFDASNVSVSDYDCYIERAIEKGFEEFYSETEGVFLIWGGSCKDQGDIYKLSVIYNKKNKTLSVSIYKEDGSHDRGKCVYV